MLDNFSSDAHFTLSSVWNCPVLQHLRFLSLFASLLLEIMGSFVFMLVISSLAVASVYRSLNMHITIILLHFISPFRCHSLSSSKCTKRLSCSILSLPSCCLCLFCSQDTWRLSYCILSLLPCCLGLSYLFSWYSSINFSYPYFFVGVVFYSFSLFPFAVSPWSTFLINISFLKQFVAVFLLNS